MTTVSSAAPALVCGAPHPHLIGLIEEFCGDAEMAARIAAGLAAVLGDGRAEPTILEVTRLFFAGLDDVVKDARDHPSSQMLQAWLRDEARMDGRQVGRVLAHLAAARDAGRLPAEARLLICGIVEVKAYCPRSEHVAQQIANHVRRLRLGLMLDGRVWPPEAQGFLVRDGGGWREVSVQAPPPRPFISMRATPGCAGPAWC